MKLIETGSLVQKSDRCLLEQSSRVSQTYWETRSVFSVFLSTLWCIPSLTIENLTVSIIVSHENDGKYAVHSYFVDNEPIKFYSEKAQITLNDMFSISSA